MKKLLLTLACAWMLCTASMKAQITLDTVVSSRLIGYDFYTVQISPDETKYFFSDTLTNTFTLYNMDFTPFMTNISVPEPFGLNSNARMQAVYITRTLFDCDSTNIEYAYYAPTNNNKPFRIVRTDGTMLFELDSAFGPYCWGGCLGMSDVIVPIRNTSNGTKLFLTKYNTTTGAQEIYIYSLCDSLPTDIFDFKKSSQSFVKIFPSPSSRNLTFQINLPDNLNKYDLLIYDGNAREIRTKEINPWDAKYTLNMDEFSGGTYYYALRANGRTYQSGKFLLTK